ncbi:MAG: thiamine diphosphokinase [Armatimonadetes bacterium 55-13]|nr:thiamine diphosphokinase [Armatimonadota bacterium]OJU63978.1 MAG: thiamine diphosphokinase [Armatimonadetes bacterium 55-13]
MASRRFLGVLAGQDLPPDVLAAWCQSADFLIAADGAANMLIRQDIVPDVVVGDMDSLDPNIRAVLPKIIESEDQLTTDCDKLIAFAVAQGAESLTIAALEGDRFDHVLAATQSALRSPVPLRLVLRHGLGLIVHARQLTKLETNPGQIVSFIAMTECHNVVMTGVRWQPEPTLSPLGATSISNEAEGEEVSIQFTEGAGILIVKRDSTEPIW